MGMRIHTNLASITAQRNLFAASRRVEGSMGRLASGLRIQRASDDAAGLAVSERMRMRSRSWQQAERNIADGKSLAYFTEGLYAEVGDMVARLRELAMASSNGTLSDADRSSLQAEATQLLEEIDRVAVDAHYNGESGIPVADGSILRVPIQVGIHADDFVYVRLTGMDTTRLGIDTVDVSNAAAAEASLAGIDTATQRVARARGRIGADLSVLESALANASVTKTNLESAVSRIRDVDVAWETAELVRANILQEVSTKVLAQANLQPELALQLLS
ncbi:MAG: flagellin FliC [Planctomycetes bacterium]|nr:flagellin FliC [Planctomycetota bacterium]